MTTPRQASAMTAPPAGGALHPRPAAHQAPAQLYALRLRPIAAQAGVPGPDDTDGLQGEVEHVLSGARCAFSGSAELVAWLQAHQGAAAPARAAADQAPGPAPRDATM